jgi:hypothetical protein
MLEDSKVAARIPVQDLLRAKSFYGEKPCNTHLGLLGEPDLERLGAFRLRHETDELLPFLG